MDENNLQHGGVKDERDIRDYLYSDIAGAFDPFDWEKGFDIEDIVGKIPVKNQFSSSSCGGQAWAYYSYVLDSTDRQEKSAKFIYAHTHVEGGGSSGRANCNVCILKGVSTEKLCPSYLPDGTTTEQFITNKEDISAYAFADALTNKERSYFAVNTDIDSVAQALRDNKGCVIGITGKNNGTWTDKFPKPPSSFIGSWNHWLFAGKAKMIKGKKYIGCLNSWGERVGDHGWQWIGEEYFNMQSAIWSCWTMIEDKQVAEKYVFSKVLRRGSRGLDVKMLQEKLKITKDGIFGKDTERAVKEFQQAHNLLVDGIVGRRTNAILNTI